MTIEQISYEQQLEKQNEQLREMAENSFLFMLDNITSITLDRKYNGASDYKKYKIPSHVHSKEQISVLCSKKTGGKWKVNMWVNDVMIHPLSYERISSMESLDYKGTYMGDSELLCFLEREGFIKSNGLL